MPTPGTRGLLPWTVRTGFSVAIAVSAMCSNISLVGARGAMVGQHEFNAQALMVRALDGLTAEKKRLPK